MSENRMNISKGGADAAQTEKRRKRNRVSQRQFRERRNQHLKELEQRVEFFSKNENERNAKLIEENNDLRRSLSQTKHQILRLRSVLDEMMEIVERDSNQLRLTMSLDAEGHCDSPQSTNESSSPTEFQEVGAANGPSEVLRQEGGSDEALNGIQQVCHEDWSTLTMEEEVTNPHSSGIQITALDDSISLEPNGMTIHNDIGMDPFGVHAAVFCAGPFSFGEGKDTKHIADTFADPILQILFEPRDAQLFQTLYILLLQRFSKNRCATLSEQIDGMISLMEDYLKLIGGVNNAKLMNRACLAAMIVFAKYVSPIPPVMWFSSACYVLVENVILWRLSRTFQLFYQLPPNYEPSDLQLSTRHPGIIDWIAFAGLKDKFIQHFGNSPMLDQVFIEMLEHVVIEVTDISLIVKGAEHGPGFLGVWNIFQAMTGGASNTNIQAVCTPSSLELHDGALSGLYQMYKMSMPDTGLLCRQASSGKGFWEPVLLSEILCSPSLARKLYHYLELYASHKYWKFDPEFFAKYAELRWDGCETTLAHGTSYRVTSSWNAVSKCSTIFSQDLPDSPQVHLSVQNDVLLH